MFAEFVSKILSLAPANVIEIAGRTFTDRGLTQIPSPIFTNAPDLRTLSGLVDYILNDPDDIAQDHRDLFPLVVHVKSEKEVVLYTSVHGPDMNREKITSCQPVLPVIIFEKPVGHEEFIIAMQSKFVKSETTDGLLSLISSMKKVDEQKVEDNGVSQTATIKTGIQIVEKTKIPNPVSLMPYRTFLEIEQPESEFVFRISEKGEPSLHEADGGAWKIEAMQNISDYLKAHLESKLADREVVILC